MKLEDFFLFLANAVLFLIISWGKILLHLWKRYGEWIDRVINR